MPVNVGNPIYCLQSINKRIISITFSSRIIWCSMQNFCQICWEGWQWEADQGSYWNVIGRSCSWKWHLKVSAIFCYEATLDIVLLLCCGKLLVLTGPGIINFSFTDGEKTLLGFLLASEKHTPTRSFLNIKLVSLKYSLQSGIS